MLKQLILFFVFLIFCSTMIRCDEKSTSMDHREKRFLSTCNLPCLTNGNRCLNGGICTNHKCDCSILPSCSGLPCATVGNKCFFGGVCTSCKEGKRCRK
ncbi:unnamed protein product [Adineta ricciae]|uniref:Uncharacterized protein n=1 Tax=Adineta ricciae TaxID=249248 RepID=A0A815BVI2_ADIRI|nr:unnamed protein product [Adineta ricciae]